MGVFSKRCAVIREKMRLPEKPFFKMGSDPKKKRFEGRYFSWGVTLVKSGQVNKGMPLLRREIFLKFRAPSYGSTDFEEPCGLFEVRHSASLLAVEILLNLPASHPPGLMTSRIV